MKKSPRVSRRILFAGGLAAFIVGAGLGIAPAAAHEAKCPICKLDVPQDTPTQDNEVAVRSGRKRIEYRCVGCAFNDAKTYTADISILAPSDVKGKPILLTRTGGKWTAQPESPVFVAAKVPHLRCPLGYRAFTSKASFDAWVRRNHDVVGDAKALSLDQMVELAK
jgi:hypothetical protein